MLLLGGPVRADGDIVLKTDDKGIAVKSNNVTVLTIEYPQLVDATGNETHKVLTKTPNSDSAGATVTYDGGATCKISIASAEIIYDFSGVPSDTPAFRTQALLNFADYQKGGTWKMDAGAATPFPADFAGAQNFFSDHGRSLTLTDAKNNSISFHMPEYTYVQLTDNRKWGWAIYAWHMAVPISPTVTEFRVSVSTGAADATPAAGG
jgi:hypothetical protein